MYTQIQTRFLFYTFTVFLCLSSFFLTDTAAQDNTASASDNYTFETIDVPGVDSLAVTASSDFEDYAGYTKSADGEKEIAFTLIDGVFTTYDFPGSAENAFYLNSIHFRCTPHIVEQFFKQSAGHYQDMPDWA
ncbi:MAG: hypothetical protein OXE50_16205 [Chloroflexi bacterium]|nr:hypothetical protein [Chloroflexota bacterium]